MTTLSLSSILLQDRTCAFGYRFYGFRYAG